MIHLNLSRGMVSLIDDADVDLTNYKWASICNGHGIFYACRTAKKGDRSPGKTLLLHRIILGRKLNRTIGSTDMVDHINGNALDNRRNNLRLANHLENMANSKKITRRKEKPATSRFKGVRLRNDTGKWEAYITNHRKRINLGCYATDIDAARVYDQAARSIFGEFANTNFHEEEQAVRESIDRQRVSA